MQLEKDSYPHPQYGKIWTPMLTIVDWMPLDGPAPAPAAAAHAAAVGVGCRAAAPPPRRITPMRT